MNKLKPYAPKKTGVLFSYATLCMYVLLIYLLNFNENGSETSSSFKYKKTKFHVHIKGKRSMKFFFLNLILYNHV